MLTTEFGNDLESALTECDLITVCQDGQALDGPENVLAPDAFVVFLNGDAEYEPSDIQVEPSGWELVELRGDGSFADGINGPVSSVKTVHPEMIQHMKDNPGIYALIGVEGVYPEYLSLYSDFRIGYALAKYQNPAP